MPPPPPAQSARLKGILASLRGPPSAPADEEARLDALSQLCELLSISTEESLGGFAVDAFVPPLVALLAAGGPSPDVSLL
eukprot:SM016258S02177  [mRNA]  locus=s16258:2:238:- [translate_table: standard]